MNEIKQDQLIVSENQKSWALGLLYRDDSIGSLGSGTMFSSIILFDIINGFKSNLPEGTVP